LKWCGVEYEGFLRGILEVDSIAYECSFHDELFDDPDDESPSGEHWDDFLALFQADVTINPNNFMGFMCPEPYPYAWSSFKKITDALRTTLPNSNNFCLTAQYPSNPGEVMDDYLNETGVDAMWFDSYPINFGTDGGAWWHTESSEDDNGTTPKSKSIQNACRLFFYGQETHPDWSSYHHGATYAAIHSVLFTCA